MNFGRTYKKFTNKPLTCTGVCRILSNGDKTTKEGNKNGYGSHTAAHQGARSAYAGSDKSTSQDEYLQSSIQVIEILQVEPENLYAEEGLGLPDGEEVDHLDDLLRADGFWLYYGVEAENFFLIQWYPDEASANAKLAQLEELGDGKQYLVDLTLKRANPSEAENFGNSNPVQLRS